jgi:hypothetical protein
MADRREGGCLCGKVRYAFTGEPLVLVACHCKDCQGQSGSAFGMSLVVPREGFELLSGEPRVYAARGDSGGAKDCMFCGDCGTRLYNAIESLPKTFNVKPGTLDDTSWLRPAAHVWVSRKQPWVPIPDGVATFERNPG